MKNLIFTLLVLFATQMTVFAGKTATNSVENTSSKKVAVLLVLDDDDQKTVTTIFTTLMSAQKVAKMLNVEVNITNDVVNDDIFIFSLKSKAQEEYAMKLFDEEGYEMGDNAFTVVEGSNYKTVNVRSLPDGTYTFKLFDKAGGEYSKEIRVIHGQPVNE
jgi:ATPase subunit of ABC transporter with duplicated ATPase domains